MLKQVRGMRYRVCRHETLLESRLDRRFSPLDTKRFGVEVGLLKKGGTREFATACANDRYWARHRRSASGSDVRIAPIRTPLNQLGRFRSAGCCTAERKLGLEIAVIRLQ